MVASADRTIVIANAGSGKTWTLANRILRWLIDEIRAGRAPEPSGTLAVTFTRKAAGEILARVLAHAAQGARAGDAGAKARRDFEPVVGTASEAEYLAALKALCADLHRLPIGTLDGYFNRIAASMPEEIGLPAEWTLGEDTDLQEIRARAAAEILADDDAEKMLDLLEQGAPKPSVTSSIESLFGSQHSITPLDIYRAVAIGGEEAVDRAYGWMKPLIDRAALEVTKSEALAAELKSLAVSAEKLNKNWQKAVHKLIELLEQRDWVELAGSNFLLKMNRNESYYSKPMPPEFARVGGEIARCLRASLIADLDRKLEGARAVLPKADAALVRLQRETGVYGFGDITRGIADAARRKDSRVADPDALRETLGVELRDLAIDEAQDTSVEQFLAMKPLLDEVLGGRGPERAGRFLLVGDPKQSIYGWRGGTPGLIAEIEQAYSGNLGEAKPLAKSFRSSPILMDFVNRVFGDIAEVLPSLVGDKKRAELIGDKIGVFDWAKSLGLPPSCTESAFTQALAQWKFVPHESARPELGGFVAAYAFGDASGDAPEAGADGDAAERESPPAEAEGGDASSRGSSEAGEVSQTECAAAIAAKILRERPGRTIGILARTNAVVADTIASLKLLGIPASDEGRATLLDSPAVAGVVAMLRLIDTPSDRISHFLVSRGPMAKVTGLAKLEERAEAAEDAIAFAADWRGRIADRGLAPVLNDVLSRLREQGLSPNDADRLARVVAIAESFADAPPERLTDFVEAVESDDASASSPDRVRVMTVHRAKGLEFDEVIVLSLDANWGEVKAPWGMVRTDPAQPPQMVALLSNESVRSWIPELSVFERDERRRRLLDELSAFYVAVTRAKRGLHLVMSSKPKGEYPTGAKLIRAALARASGAADRLAGAPSIAHEYQRARVRPSEPFWTCEYVGEVRTPKEAAADSPRAADPPRAADSPRAADRPSAAEIAEADSPRPLVEIKPRAGGRAASPSSHAPRGLWALDPFTNDDIALRGVLVHECFREVHSIEDLVDASARAAIIERARRRAAAEKREPISDELAHEVEVMLARIASDRGRPGTIARALDLDAAGNTVRVYNELAFTREVNGAIVNGRIDRLVLLLRDGVPIGATIIDYKTGAADASSENLAEKVSVYREQLAAYGDAVAEMFTIPRGAVQLELLFVDRGEVVVLGST
jgi:ATP-dependent exoDNAse (exonuclease V) beta subunit